MNCLDYQAGRCRSCSAIEVPYPRQLAAKQARAEAALAPFGPDWLPAMASTESGFRNKAKLAVGGSMEAPTLGILDAAGGGIDLARCPLYPESMRATFEPLRDFLVAARVPPYDLATRKGEAKYLHLFEAPGTGELMLRIVLRSREPLDRIRKALPGLLAACPQLKCLSANLLPQHAALLEGPEEIPLLGVGVRALLNEVPLHLHPGAFFQTHSALAAALYQQARAWLDDPGIHRILDLYCGVGGFALHLAGAGREVLGVESSAQAVAGARRAAAESGLAARFECADATRWQLGLPAGFDAIVVNPPRRGLGAALCAELSARPPGWILYSSCAVDTLAADLARLPGFGAIRARLFDFFPHTAHFETLVLLRRQGLA
jgi:23S rRNA (uracil747-C5)-methyltransferase